MTSLNLTKALILDVAQDQRLHHSARVIFICLALNSNCVIITAAEPAAQPLIDKTATSIALGYIAAVAMRGRYQMSERTLILMKELL